MPKNIYRVQGDEQPGKALHVTIPREIAQRHGIHKHTEVEIRDCQEIDKEGRVVNVMKVVKVGQAGEVVMPKAEPFDPCGKNCPDCPAECRVDIEELRQQANNGDALACLYLGQLGRKQGEKE